MQIIICDDSKEERAVLLSHIHNFSLSMMVDYVIEEFENAENLIQAMRNQRIQPHILFMDIYMKGMNGMDAAKILLDEGFTGSIIFTTTSVNHSIESYKIMADGYLLKPYTREEFNRNFEKAIFNYTKSYKTISFTSDRLEFQLYLKDLEYVEAATRGCLLHSKGETIRTSKVLSEFIKELKDEECFLQCHRSCLINLNFVAKVEDEFIRLKSGDIVPITLRDKQSIKKAVGDYFFLKMREN